MKTRSETGCVLTPENAMQGSNPRTLRSRPEPKSALQMTEPPRRPKDIYFYRAFYILVLCLQFGKINQPLQYCHCDRKGELAQVLSLGDAVSVRSGAVSVGTSQFCRGNKEPQDLQGSKPPKFTSCSGKSTGCPDPPRPGLTERAVASLTSWSPHKTKLRTLEAAQPASKCSVENIVLDTTHWPELVTHMASPSQRPRSTVLACPEEGGNSNYLKNDNRQQSMAFPNHQK